MLRDGRICSDCDAFGHKIHSIRGKSNLYTYELYKDEIFKSTLLNQIWLIADVMGSESITKFVNDLNTEPLLWIFHLPFLPILAIATILIGYSCTPKTVGIAVVISLLSCLQTDIYDYTYLKFRGSHLGFWSHLTAFGFDPPYFPSSGCYKCFVVIIEYSGKFTKAFPLTPSGYKMAAKTVI